uniref:Rx N-terminal domain-containing protein n=1 Tax=Oryza rufipogon TaxID=4529 RepID=A0A0E0REY3_ORYRU
MEATAVSLARSVLDVVLSSVGPAVADEVARFLGVPKEVQFIRNELEMMQAFIKTASSSLHPDAAAAAGGGDNDILRTWVKQVRDLAYDIEDCLLDFALYAARISSSPTGSSWLRPGPLAARRRIADRIRELKASVEELNQLRLRYHIVVDDHHHPSRTAWVTVPHPLDGADEFRRRLRKQLGLGLGAAAGDDQNVIQDYLREKRYIIMVDDLLSQEEWDQIWQVLKPLNNKGSVVIVTTRRKDVAGHCAGLAPEEHGHVYRTPNYTLPEDMKPHISRILKGCWGLPLAISTIGGLLANRPKTGMEWKKLHEHLGVELESDQLQDITKVLVSSYHGLPYHLKPIFLYLSIFPENNEIRRTRLLRRWIAEGYIANNRDMPVEVVGERFFNELINRSMIQSSKVNHGLKVDRCRVHGMMLHIILSKSIDENQLFVIKKHCNEVPQSKIRHLVVNRWKKRDEKLENINLSLIRSLTVFGECPASLITPEMRMLRVLDLEDMANLKNEDLKHIGKLRHLRYLGLRGTDISKLPSSLQNLLYLETLDIQDTQVTQLPDGIAKLEKLRYLLAGVNFSRDLLQKMPQFGMENHNSNLLGNLASCLYCYNAQSCEISGMDQFSVMVPEGIEKLRNLHMLSVVNVRKSKDVAGKLERLTNLQRLGVTGLGQEEGKELWNSIKNLNRLQRLEVRSESLDFLVNNKDIDATPPKYLVSLRLCGLLDELPVWIKSLNDLTKVKLIGTQLKQDDIHRLKDLRNLASLGLWEKSYKEKSLIFNDGTFRKLIFLDIDGLEIIETVNIEKGAMPELQQLWVNRCQKLSDDDNGLSGVLHLLNLNELVLKKCGPKEKLVQLLQRQLSTHVKRPNFLVGKSISPTSSEASTSTATQTG